MTAAFRSAADILAGYRAHVISGEPPTVYRVGTGGFARLEFGPRLVSLLGAAPGVGKTALTMQFVVDALRLNPDMRAVVFNVEMPPEVLVDRQLARLSGVDLRTIRYREFGDEHRDRLEAAFDALGAVADRLAFGGPPFDLGTVAAAADDFGADLIVLDYIQRFRPAGEQKDKRSSVNAVMEAIRLFADAGKAVLAVAAVSRTKNRAGNSGYGGLGLASFRESSELEFGCDDAYVLDPDPKDRTQILMRHVKSRHGEPRDLQLTFDGRHQRFTAEDAPGEDDAPARPDVAALWDRTKAAPEGRRR